MQNIFKAILSNPNTNDEQNNTLTCIWNLCFDEKICEQIKKDKEIVQLLTNIKNSCPSEEMQKKSAGILFTINDLQKKVELSRKSIDSQNKGNHIMISYNWASRDICIKIKDELKVFNILLIKNM